MRQELNRVDPLRAANIGAVVYGLTMSVMAVIFVPFFIVFGLFAQSAEAGAAGVFMALVMLVFYPIMGVVMGWISGFLVSFFYNLVVRWTGGLLLDFDEVPSDATSSRI